MYGLYSRQHMLLTHVNPIMIGDTMYNSLHIYFVASASLCKTDPDIASYKKRVTMQLRNSKGWTRRSAKRDIRWYRSTNIFFLFANLTCYNLEISWLYVIPYYITRSNEVTNSNTTSTKIPTVQKYCILFLKETIVYYTFYGTYFTKRMLWNSVVKNI